MLEGSAAVIIILAVLMGSWTFGAVLSWILVAKNAQKTTQHNTKRDKN